MTKDSAPRGCWHFWRLRHLHHVSGGRWCHSCCHDTEVMQTAHKAVRRLARG